MNEAVDISTQKEFLEQGLSVKTKEQTVCKRKIEIRDSLKAIALMNFKASFIFHRRNRNQAIQCSTILNDIFSTIEGSISRKSTMLVMMLRWETIQLACF